MGRAGIGVIQERIVWLLLCLAVCTGLLNGQMQAPAGWSTQATSGRVIVRSPDGMEFVSVEALVAGAGAMNASKWLKELKGRGRYVGGQAQGAASATGVFLEGNTRIHALLAIRGGMGTLMLAGAPQPRFAERIGGLVRILESLSLSPAAAPRSSLAFERIQDSKENAFSVEVPRGWRSEAGLYRLGATDTRSEVNTQSPDGSVFAFSGDRNLGKFMVLTPQLIQFGAREGGAYNTGTSSFTYMRYLPGAQFAQSYVQRRFAGLKVATSRDLPDLARQMSAERYKLGNPNGGRLDCGEVEFEWQGKVGRVLVTTEISGGAMGNYFWGVAYLQGYLAEPGRAGQAGQVATRLLESGRVNPQWMMGELGMQANIAKQNIDALHHTQEVQARMMNERWASADRRSNAAGEELLGRYQMRDPVSGEAVTVAAGSNYYYRVGKNGVAGTNAELGNFIQGEGGPIEVTRLLRVGVE